MTRPFLLLTFLALVLPACDKDALSEKDDEGSVIEPGEMIPTPSEGGVVLWTEPGDKFTATPMDPIRIGLRGGYALNDTLTQEVMDGVELVKWSSRENVSIALAIEENTEAFDPHTIHTSYIHVTPQEALSDEWYALKIKRGAEWAPRGDQHVIEGEHIFYRFTSLPHPLVRAFVACPKGDDLKLEIEYSERVQTTTSPIAVTSMQGASCAKLANQLDQTGKDVVTASEGHSDFLCRGLTLNDTLLVGGLSGVSSQADPSISLAGANTFTLSPSTMKARTDGCRTQYVPEL